MLTCQLAPGSLLLQHHLNAVGALQSIGPQHLADQLVCNTVQGELANGGDHTVLMYGQLSYLSSLCPHATNLQGVLQCPVAC
jgi:hypothetical protein